MGNGHEQVADSGAVVIDHREVMLDMLLHRGEVGAALVFGFVQAFFERRYLLPELGDFVRVHAGIVLQADTGANIAACKDMRGVEAFQTLTCMSCVIIALSTKFPSDETIEL